MKIVVQKKVFFFLFCVFSFRVMWGQQPNPSFLLLFSWFWFFVLLGQHSNKQNQQKKREDKTRGGKQTLFLQGFGAFGKQATKTEHNKKKNKNKNIFLSFLSCFPSLFLVFSFSFFSFFSLLFHSSASLLSLPLPFAFSPSLLSFVALTQLRLVKQQEKARNQKRDTREKKKKVPTKKKKMGRKKGYVDLNPLIGRSKGSWKKLRSAERSVCRSQV